MSLTYDYYYYYYFVALTYWNVERLISNGIFARMNFIVDNKSN